jgi:arginyl-tRNA synthetase
MNIFDKFLDKIKPLILNNQNGLGITKINEFKGVTAESPPAEFDFDLSLNISLVLGKINKQNPKDLALKIKN